MTYNILSPTNVAIHIMLSYIEIKVFGDQKEGLQDILQYFDCSSSRVLFTP